MGLKSDNRSTVLLVHGWDDDPTAGWLGWLARELQAQGFGVVAPVFETKPKPSLVRWARQLNSQAKYLDHDSIIIGHSLGCWLAMRLLESMPTDNAVAKLILVAGFADSPNSRSSKYFQPAPDWDKLRMMAKQRLCIYSDDDKLVSPARTRQLAHVLDGELICFPEHGHFLGSRGMTTFPELLDLIIQD